MHHHHMIALTQAKPGQEEELHRWYDEHHIAEILAVPGIVAARRCRVGIQKGGGPATPQWHSLAIYEVEADDPQTVLAEISRRRLSGELSWTDAVLMESTLQIVGADVE